MHSEQGRVRQRGPVGTGGPNLRDVARLAGVSIATASRTLRSTTTPRTAGQRAVHDAAAALGYSSNDLVRSMAGTVPRAVVFVSAVMVGSSFAAVAEGVEEVSAKTGHPFLMSTSRADPAREEELVASAIRQRAAAVVLVGGSTDATFATRTMQYRQRLATIGARLVVCGATASDVASGLLSATYDQAAGVRAAIAHLARLGHTHVAFVGGQPDNSTARSRVDAFLAAAAAHHLRVDVIDTANDIGVSADAVSHWLRRHGRATGLMCFTDLVAIGAIKALRANGLDVPGDMSVVGFDDDPLVSELTPPLTTVRVPFRDLGHRAGEIAVGLRETAPLLPVELVVRGSTGPPLGSPRP